MTCRSPAEADGLPAYQALAWLIAREGVTAPIASATSVAQVESFAKAATLSLNADEIARLTDTAS
ncbi:aldo/keto reductase [Acuticoccus sediminis]|uniref:aldo/keto reductase n=1 Tax=Acuticoccus sediminis TaxID=2184697 RepID=UPI001CFD0C0C|nr:aldo/keto reductase [Acuticoccus sediminis]